VVRTKKLDHVTFAGFLLIMLLTKSYFYFRFLFNESNIFQRSLQIRPGPAEISQFQKGVSKEILRRSKIMTQRTRKFLYQ